MQQSLTVLFNDVTLRLVGRETAEIEQVIKIMHDTFCLAADEIDDMKKYLSRKMTGNGNMLFSFAAVRDDRIIGILNVQTLPSGLQFMLSDLAVIPAEQHQGVGRALMTHAEHFIQQRYLLGDRGILYLSDGTKESNPQSNFYEKLGYAALPSRRRTAEGLPILQKKLNFF